VGFDFTRSTAGVWLGIPLLIPIITCVFIWNCEVSILMLALVILMVVHVSAGRRFG